MTLNKHHIIGGWALITLLAAIPQNAAAATPSVFSTAVAKPNGLAAVQGKLLVTTQANPSAIIRLDGNGNILGPNPFATLPAGLLALQEVYLVVSPGAAGSGFAANDVYAVRGNKVFKVPAAGGAATLFADLSGAPFNVPNFLHSGITFDRVGTFGFKMIVCFENGAVYTVDSAGVPTLLAQLTASPTEGPDVAPSGFSGASGNLLVAQEDRAAIVRVSGPGAFADYKTNFYDPESIHIVPANVCTFKDANNVDSGGAFFTTDFANNRIIKYPPADFATIGGNALIPLEFTAAGGFNIKMIDKNTGIIGDFDPNGGIVLGGANAMIHEGSTFVDCTVPPPTSAPGRMTGGGSVFTAAGVRVTHGFEIHCDTADVPNNLEINWDGGNNFHLELLVTASCFLDTNIDQEHPKAFFNTYIGSGTGKLNGVNGASAVWTFTDAGEPGSDDHATITIKDPNNVTVLTVSGFITKGNQQAHIDNK